MILKPPKFNAYYDVMDVKPVDGAKWRLELAGQIADKRAWTVQDLQAAAAAIDGDQAYLRRRLGLYRRLEGRARCAPSWSVSAPTCGRNTSLSRRRTTTRAASTWRPHCIPQTMLALQYADETLADPFGYPLRLRMATKLGYKNPKWITAIEVTNTYPGGFWEEKGFPWFAGI